MRTENVKILCPLLLHLFLKFKILLGKVNILFWNTEFLTRKIVKHCRLARIKGKTELIRVQRLILISFGFIGAIDTILSVTDEGVAYMCHVRAYLVSPARQQLHLKQPIAATYRSELRYVIFCNTSYLASSH